MLLHLDALALPDLRDFRDEHRRGLARGVYPVVVVIEDDRYVELVAEWEEVVYVVADLQSAVSSEKFIYRCSPRRSPEPTEL